jgi:hypothetical protein
MISFVLPPKEPESRMGQPIHCGISWLGLAYAIV